jgi:DNA topoisomerase-1
MDLPRTRNAADQQSVQAATQVGLRYVRPDMPGIRRERSGNSFRFRYPSGDPVSEPEVLKRIKSLAIPPAWSDVWVCPDPRGHLQATGKDARGRRQYRYNRRWREGRDETKFARMIAFGKTLPRIRKRVASDLLLKGLPRRKVLATVVRLLETSLIRVGNEEYAKANDSFGLTTMRDRHVRVDRGKVRFSFRGKSGKWHEIDVKDKRLARIVKSCQDIPGQELFQYVDDQAHRQKVNSEDVNEYIREVSRADFTAKDFRTWSGTVLAALALQEFEEFKTKAQAKKQMVAAIERVALRLGNTPAVCRKCYVHPEVFAAFTDGTLARLLQHRAEQELARGLSRLTPQEAAVLGMLQQRLKMEGKLADWKMSLNRERARSRSKAGRS